MPVHPMAALRRTADSPLWLGAVAAAYSLAQLVFVSPRLGLGWDETIYVSQVATSIPASPVWPSALPRPRWCGRATRYGWRSR